MILGDALAHAVDGGNYAIVNAILQYADEQKLLCAKMIPIREKAKRTDFRSLAESGDREVVEGDPEATPCFAFEEKEMLQSDYDCRILPTFKCGPECDVRATYGRNTDLSDDGWRPINDKNGVKFVGLSSVSQVSGRDKVQQLVNPI